jgi:hypothetical protein
MSRKGFPWTVPGMIPTVTPPCSFAPREAASITPPRPPQQRIAFSRAMRDPAVLAAPYSSPVHSSFPMTAICMPRNPPWEHGAQGNKKILFNIFKKFFLMEGPTW